jgi:hypothetical protein
MSATDITVIVVVAVLAAALVAAAWLLWRHQALRRRFGPEYRRLAKQMGPVAAERELRERERRHGKLPLGPLDEASRQRYRAAWTELQTRFVDEPEQTVDGADQLVNRLIAERGYTTEDYDEQLALLSVDHAGTLEQYRSAHEIHRRHQGEATTDQLRVALVDYRALFADLLGADPVEHPRPSPIRTRQTPVEEEAVS